MPKIDFNKDVVELSFQKPVLLDFWAEWCGPCKILGPVLEELEKEDKGKWILIKINTEEELEISQYFKIQSLPSCKLIYEGKMVDEFTGVQTKAVLRQWFDKNFNLLFGEEVEALSDDFKEIISQQKLIPDKDFMSVLKDYVLAHPEHELASIYLAKHEAFYHPAAAKSRLESLSPNKNAIDLLPYFEVIEEFIQFDFDESTPSSKLLKESRQSLLDGNGQKAIDLIINVLNTDAKYANELARRTGIALFNIWGNQYELTKENRKLFDMAIW